MHPPRKHRSLVLAAAVVVLVAATAGCARRAVADGAEAGTGSTPVASQEAETVAATPDARPDATPATSLEPDPTELAATPPPPPPLPKPSPTAAPLKAPDLTAIQRLLDELDAALGADATADTDEGSVP